MQHIRGNTIKTEARVNIYTFFVPSAIPSFRTEKQLIFYHSGICRALKSFGVKRFQFRANFQAYAKYSADDSENPVVSPVGSTFWLQMNAK